MGMFDTVKVKNIKHKNFKHNGYIFQTKDIGLSLSEYEIVNDRLCLKVDGGEYPRVKVDKDVKYDGCLDLYTYIKVDGIDQRVEYHLTFKDGLLNDVVMINRYPPCHKQKPVNKPTG